DKNSPVVCTVEDCGYTAIEDQLSFMLKVKVPWLPAVLNGFLIKAVRQLLKFKAGFSSLEAAPVKKLPDCKIPMLSIHGVPADSVPLDMLERLYNAHIGPKQQLVVKGAKHAEAIYVDTETYINTVQNFVRTYTNKGE
ncbi:MAG: alpha/beta hydrolase, partial [Eubacteriales bacterium]|nr:alpha/beta hydrolase [Eubacteriales bacterium]